MARLGERNCYYFVEYDDGSGRTDLMPHQTARDYASMFVGTVHIHDTAPWWRKRLFHMGK